MRNLKTQVRLRQNQNLDDAGFWKQDIMIL